MREKGMAAALPQFIPSRVERLSMLFLTLTTVSFLSVHATYMDDVNKFIDFLNKHDTGDVLKDMSNFGKDMGEFVRLSGAISGPAINGELTPEEYKAHQRAMDRLLNRNRYRSRQPTPETTTQTTTTTTTEVPFIPGTYTADATKLLEKFARVYHNKNNVLGELKDLTENSHQMFNLAGRVGSLMAAVVDKTSPDGSMDERRALVKLHAAMQLYFNNSEDDIANRLYETSVIELFKYQNYEKAVTQVLSDVYTRFSPLISGKLPMGKGEKEYFAFTCFDQDPTDILMFLDMIYREMCHLPTKDEIQLYAGAQAAIRRVEWRIKGPKTESQKLEKAKKKVLAATGVLSEEEASHYVQRIANIEAATYDDLTKELLFIAADYEGQGLLCPLDVTALLQPEKRPEFMAKIRTVTLDLLRTQVLSMACNGLLAGGKADLEEMARHGAPLVKAIGEGIVTWVQHVQNLSWPEVSVEAVKKRLGSGQIPVEKYNETARIVREELEKHGPERYSYQVLVTETREEGIYWSVSAGENYANLKGFKGIDCHIFRYPKNVKAAVTLSIKKYQELKAFLRKASPNMRAAEVLPSLLPLLSGQFHKSVILLKKRAYFKENAEFRAGEAFGPSSNTSIAVEYFANPPFSRAYTWKLYLLL